MSEGIIIDGVNVAECCCHENGKCLWTKRYYENNIVPVCEKVKDCYYKQLKRLQKTLKHTENGKKVKAEKLKRIEEIVIHCIQGGFTDEFVQEIFDICREYEEV